MVALWRRVWKVGRDSAEYDEVMKDIKKLEDDGKLEYSAL